MRAFTIGPSFPGCQWEGSFRVPAAIKPGTIINDIAAHEDMIPTLLTAEGDSTVKEDLLKGKKVGDTTFKVHRDGYNLISALKGVSEWPRKEFIPAYGVRSCNHTVLVPAHSRTSMGLRDPRFEWAQAGVNTSFTRCTLIFRVCFSA